MDMSESLEVTERTSLGTKVRLKRNKLIFFALNLLLVVPRALRLYSPVGLAGTAVILLVMFLLTVYKSDAGRPASRNLPLMGVLDVCIFAVQSYQQLRFMFNPDNIERLLSNLNPSIYLLLMVPTIAVGIVFRKILWLGGVGRAAAGAVFILAVFSDGEIPIPHFYGDIKYFFVLYLLCAVGWLILCAIAYYTDPKTLTASMWLSWALLAALFVLCTAATGMVPALAAATRGYIMELSRVGLAWWKVLLAAVALAGGCVAAYDYDNRKMGSDSVVLGAMASGFLLMRILISFYVIFNWILFPVFLAGSLRCLYDEARKAKTLRLIAPVYLPVQLAVLVLADYLMKTGLWMLAILICVYTVVFYATAGKHTTPGYRRFHWLVVLSCPAVLAAGYIWHRCFTLWSLVLIGMMYVVFAFAIVLLEWPHPGNQDSPDTYKWIVCGFMALLCLITLTRYGAKVRVTFIEEDNSAVITVDARGKDNAVTYAEISWSGLTGESSGRERPLLAGETILPIEDEKLTIVVTDAYGVTTTVTDWYPKWRLEAQE